MDNWLKKVLYGDVIEDLISEDTEDTLNNDKATGKDDDEEKGFCFNYG